MKYRKIIFSSLFFIIILVFIYIFINNNHLTKYAKKLPLEEKDKYLIAMMEQENVTKYFLNEFETIDMLGDNTFLIMPKYNDMEIEIYQLSLNENGDLEEKYFKTLSEPFYLICNQSDLYPNAKIRINYYGKTLEYSPFYSLKDGTINKNEKILFIEQ